MFVDNSGAFAAFDTSPAINESGVISFLATLDGSAVGNGIFTGADPVGDRVIYGGQTLFGSTFGTAFISNASINNAGQIAFQYTLSNGVTGIAVATPLDDSADFNEDGAVDGADFSSGSAGSRLPAAREPPATQMATRASMRATWQSGRRSTESTA